MLTDVLESTLAVCEKSVQDSNRLKAGKENAKSLEKVLTMVSDLEVTLASWTECRERGWLLRIDEAEVLAVVDVLIPLRTQLDASMGLDGSTTTDLSTAVTKLKHALDTQWQRTVGQECATLANALDTCRPLIDNVGILDQTRGCLSKLSQSFPASGSIPLVQKSLEKARAMLDSLGTTDQIQEFIKKVGANTATMADVSREVLTWLESHKLLEKIKVRF